jgi:hypothetical protein
MMKVPSYSYETIILQRITNSVNGVELGEV